jgi:hypothetical protein
LALIWWQGAKRTQADKCEFSSKSLLARVAAVEDSEVVNCDLLALLDISQYMDGVLFDVLVPAFLGVVVARMINTTCIKKNTPFPPIIPEWKSVRSDDSKVLRGSIVRVNVMQREEGSPLVRSERIDLPVYGCR